jgi:hypothetical protein
VKDKEGASFLKEAAKNSCSLGYCCENAREPRAKFFCGAFFQKSDRFLKQEKRC